MNDIEGFCGIFEMKPIRNCPHAAARNYPLGLALGLKTIIARGRLDRASQSPGSMRSIAARCPAFTRGYNIWHPCRGDELIWDAISDMRSTHDLPTVIPYGKNHISSEHTTKNLSADGNKRTTHLPSALAAEPGAPPGTDPARLPFRSLPKESSKPTNI
jgi:hypothetical protein